LLGRIRKGNLQARAIKDAGRWRLTELTVELTQPDEHIDLVPLTISCAIKAADRAFVVVAGTKNLPSPVLIRQGLLA
jgi:hypothetical protein